MSFLVYGENQDPVDRSRPNLEEVFGDMIWDTLVHQKLVEDPDYSERRRYDQHQALLEVARKLAKDSLE
jgi:hypothetical protein